MAPYSMDLRTRVVADRAAGLPAQEVASEFRVSVSWVNRLMQRRRETGEVGPRPQTVFKKHAFAGRAASLSSVWRALERLELTVKKTGTRRRTTPARRRR